MDGRRRSGFPAIQDVYPFNLRFVILLLQVFDKSHHSSSLIRFPTARSEERERERGGGGMIFKKKSNFKKLRL